MVIAGPNGAGKTTVSRRVVAETLGIGEFVNADVIAAGLSGFEPERAAFAAGRVMLTRMDELAKQQASFAFETTLASRTFAPWLRERMANGYRVHLVYVWLASPETAIRRVSARIRKGGHAVPPDTIRRRYGRSAWNLVNLFLPIAQASGTWRIYDNSRAQPVLVAHGASGDSPAILDANCYNQIQDIANAKQED